MHPVARKSLLAVAVLVFTLTLFGDNLRALHGMSANSLAGEQFVASRSRLERKGLRNFGESNAYQGDGPGTGAGGDRFEVLAPNAAVDTRADALSTFAVDVDTLSYAVARRALGQGQRPAPESVRVEEWVNAFDYDLAPPTDAPFAVHVEGAPSPFHAQRTLLKVSLKGREVANADRKPAHLVFLVDTSCSMSGSDRLPLAKQALHTLVENLNPRDTVAVATYAGDTRVVLDVTPASQRSDILRAIDSLATGGGTHMDSGMELAYRLAVRQVRAGEVSRVVVLTDGDANIGRTGPQDILQAVKRYVDDGVTLTTVGFGQGNLRGDMLERLADSGNGQALYIDSEEEAQKVFGTQLSSTVEHIARDVKVQVAFDPRVVKQYRLLGYENRAVADADFRNDAVDGGELGAGHSVTALYELELTGEQAPLGTVRVRGLHVDRKTPFEVEQVVTARALHRELDGASADLQFATAVALAADVLRGNTRDTGDWSLAAIVDLAARNTAGRADRAEFVRLVRALVERTGGARTVQLVSGDVY